MPGILPMKVIKVGSNAQSRIAQACDRCRSKKIRCDGIRPSCTQCVNVGFECKTSDKLSRRAFPRGYTESLEERVRGLEAEVRELKDLLDGKDEKIDMLSRIHSNSPRRTSVATNSSSDCQEEAAQEKDVIFKVLQSPLLLDDENSDAYFMGTSSGRMLIDAFKHKIQETGRPCPHMTPEAFFPTELKTSPSVHSSANRILSWKAPPRLVSDQLVNIFFQEWAPLFPVLHRPTFLTLYEEYVAKPESVSDKKSLVQLNLVFSVAAMSSDSRNLRDIEASEVQWQSALESLIMDNTLSTLQCLVLAQLYCLQKADYARLLKYNGLAVSLSHRLGLHQSQKRFALGALTSETRKKVFWTLYTLDCFCAAQLGLPKLIKEDDVHCEYPTDADDEYVTEKGFAPSLPGEFTKLSSALALFRASRILARVLTENYPATASHELSFRKLIALSDELDEWSKNLAPHLRLQFAQDKPSTGVISSRSPLLSLTYHYIRSLIYRPAVCSSSDIGDRASTALVALAASSKHIVQIVQLLEERKLSFTFCVNRDELMVLSGFGLLFQGITLDPEGKLMKDVQNSVRSVIEILGRWYSPGAADFKRLSCSMLSISLPETRRPPALSRHNSDGTMSAPQDAFRATQKQLKAIVSRLSMPSSKHNRHETKEPRRATLPNISSTSSVSQHPNPSRASISSIRSEPPHTSRSELVLTPLSLHSSPPGPAPPPNPRKRTSVQSRQVPNLDYLPLGPEPASTTPAAPSATYPYATNTTGKSDLSQTDWERLLSSLDNGQTNIYDTIYGGLPVEALGDMAPLAARGDPQLVWSPKMWSLAADTLGTQPPQSVLSLSDESLTSGSEVFAAEDFGGQGPDSYGGIFIPGDLSPAPGDLVGLVGLDGGFGL